MQRWRHGFALGCAGLVLLAAGFVLGRQTAPMDYKSVSEEVLGAIDLAPEIDSVANRELRLSRTVIAPGGHVGLHSHHGDPSIVYILSGVLTNHHDDRRAENFHPDQVFAEFGPRAHWVENRGSTPAILIVANIHRRQ
jgi:quercetin dioxygenase-like cupin family protein